MNEILLLILTWVPIPAELVFMIFIFVGIKKRVNNAVSTPEKQLEKLGQLEKKIGFLASQLMKSNEENEQLHKDNVSLKMELRGHNRYGEKHVSEN